MPKVSIIIPVYNAQRYLSKTLDSVINQTFADLEIVCVNDGSTDDSFKILQDYKNRDDRIKIVNQENGGGSAARNAGLQHATGDYVMFIDADDIYAKNIVAEAYNRAKETDADIVLYNFARFVGKPTHLAVKSKLTPGRDIKLFTKDNYAKRFFNDFAIITWNKLVKRNLIIDNGLAFDTKLSHNHDVDFSIRLMLAAESYSWLDMVGYYYRSNDIGLTATKRSDPTNVLKILTKLNELVENKYVQLKQSFDNYLVDMIAGTLEKYGNDSDKQKQVFDFAYNTLIPLVGLNKMNVDYLFTQSADVFRFVKDGDYDKYSLYANTPRRVIRRKLRKIYDTAQGLLSRFTV